jgi:hypothetical protein
MTDRRRQFDEPLRAKEGDAGYIAGLEILDAYVDRELAGKDPAREFPAARSIFRAARAARPITMGCWRPRAVGSSTRSALLRPPQVPATLVRSSPWRPTDRMKATVPARDASWLGSRGLDRTEAMQTRREETEMP